MSLAPADIPFRQALREMFRRLSPFEQTVWIGFNNKDYLKSPGPLMNEGDLLHMTMFKDRLCWKACLYLYTDENYYHGGIVEIGSGRMYALRNRKNTDLLSWTKPDYDIEEQLARLANRR